MRKIPKNYITASVLCLFVIAAVFINVIDLAAGRAAKISRHISPA